MQGIGLLATGSTGSKHLIGRLDFVVGIEMSLILALLFGGDSPDIDDFYRRFRPGQARIANEGDRVVPYISVNYASEELTYMDTLAFSISAQDRLGLRKEAMPALRNLRKDVESRVGATLKDQSLLTTRRTSFLSRESSLRFAGLCFSTEGLVALRHPFIRDVLQMNAEEQEQCLRMLLSFEDAHFRSKGQLFAGADQRPIDGNAQRERLGILVKAGKDFEVEIWSRVLTNSSRKAIIAIEPIPEGDLKKWKSERNDGMRNELKQRSV